MTGKSVQLAQECKRLSESCLYTSTSFFIWLKYLRLMRLIFVVVPLILGSIASWKLLTTSSVESVKLVTAVCSFFAGLLPSIYSALKLDQNLEMVARLAAQFKNLQDGFRMLALVSARKAFSEFETEFKQMFGRLEEARLPSLTPPEWVFKMAQKKVKSGDYSFDVDIVEEPDLITA